MDPRPYLPDEDFFGAFHMSKDDFYALKNWKQRELKRGLGIF